MKVVGVPEAKWTEIRGKLMRVFLDEHDNILRSYQAQKRGGGSGEANVRPASPMKDG